MAEKILADSPHTVPDERRVRPIITEELQDQVRARGVDLEHVSGVAARILRGQELFDEHAREIVYLENDVWLVPSANGSEAGRYLVNVRTSYCECADYQHRGAGCKHLAAALIADAKSRTCSCCREKVLGRFTTEVTEEDELLSWYPGDILCGDCIKEGYWV